MRKIFSLIFSLFIIFIQIQSVFWYQKPEIISREQWWADEEYRYLDSTYWEEIIEKNKIQQENQTQAQKDHAQNQAEKNKNINSYLNTHFNDYLGNTIISKKENNRPLAWNIAHSDKIYWIVVHHTATPDIYESDEQAVQRIYKFHALTREWWDVWYNFLIWKNGKIYEWRAGWETTVAAHDKWNNIWNIWISLIWDYSHEWINPEQQKALKELMSYLIQKYNIDLNAWNYFHKECLAQDCENPIISEKLDPIIGHRDAWHTDCPGEELYGQMQEISFQLRNELWFSLINTAKIKKSFQNISQDKMNNLWIKIDNYIEKLDENKQEDWKKIMYYKEIIKYISKESEFKKKYDVFTHKNIEKENIKVKLSYPHSDFISISDGNKNIEIIKDGNKLIDFATKKSENFYFIKWEREYLEIKSWERKPDWDSKNIYNDNKFRGDLLVYINAWKLTVVNILPLWDYLKWLWEVSNTESEHKAKTIFTSARTYAYWYMTQARKFPGETYDASDDPNVFQKYLWYSLEMRSPRLNKFLDETKNQIISYNWEIIKPWYSSQTSGKTLSYYEYCIQNNEENFCEENQKKYPFLVWVQDPGSIGKTQYWHWVWVSWAGAKYFSDKWWNYNMIIWYYLPGVEINYLPKRS